MLPQTHSFVMEHQMASRQNSYAIHRQLSNRDSNASRMLNKEMKQLLTPKRSVDTTRFD